MDSTNSPLPALEEQVEKDLVDRIIAKLDTNKMSPEDAQKLAQSFLQLLPMKDKHDLLQKLEQLGENYPDAGALYTKYANLDEEAKKQEKLKLMSQHIQNGDIEQAIHVAKNS